MILILGPDHSGKTALAQKLNLPYYHFDKDSAYTDYLKPLCELKLLKAVLDRWCICEYPYATVMNRKFQFTLKEWHNLLLLTLAQNPVVVLCTHKPALAEYSGSQYLPYEKWDECLRLYRHFLSTHKITYIEYDYTALGINPPVFAIMSATHVDAIKWWLPMWREGCGYIGSPHPKVLLVAERIGPNNMNNLPFETGPTGRMLTDLLIETGTPLGKFAVTNLVKSHRRDPRPPNDSDLSLLRLELYHLKPEKVVFMGSVAKQGIVAAEELGIEHVEMAHFGYYSHRGITDVSPYVPEWGKIMGVIPSLTFRKVEP